MSNIHLLPKDDDDPVIRTIVEYTDADGDRRSAACGDLDGSVSPYPEQYEDVFVFTLFGQYLDEGDDEHRVLSQWAHQGDLDLDELAYHLDGAAAAVRATLEAREIEDLLDDIENNHEEPEA